MKIYLELLRFITVTMIHESLIYLLFHSSIIYYSFAVINQWAHNYVLDLLVIYSLLFYLFIGKPVRAHDKL